MQNISLMLSRHRGFDVLGQTGCLKVAKLYVIAAVACAIFAGAATLLYVTSTSGQNDSPPGVTTNSTEADSTREFKFTASDFFAIAWVGSLLIVGTLLFCIISRCAAQSSAQLADEQRTLI